MCLNFVLKLFNIKIMKKSVLILFTLSILMSCGSSKTLKNSKKVIKGEWTLSKIDYSSIGTFNITLLNDVSKGCFEGSTWQFVPNNYTGSYTINNSSCFQGERYFNFDIQEINSETGLYDFLLKPTNKKGKSETNKGFRLKLTLLTDTNMQWQQTIYKDGKPFIINMNFTK